MDQKELATTEELKHLEVTQSLAKKELDETLGLILSLEEEMETNKEDAKDNVTFGIADANDPDDFEAFIELSQSMTHVDKLSEDYETYQARAKMLRALLKTPYFARIDFQFDEFDTEKVYIGRRALTDKRTRDVIVYDWRAPIASVFYRFMSGPASYDAPCGRIDGELTLKRQFEIKEGNLEFFFDSDRNINDKILRQILSKNTSPQMKAIVETIQSDQDTIIRDMENDLLMVQGVAGSGKTSIALHRAAYLMYQGAQSRLTADSILVLSPNSTFEEYISGVLPELGEENVTSAVFRDLLKDVIKEYYVEPHYEYLEHCLAGHKNSDLMKQSMALKTSEHFLELLNFFLEDLPERLLPYQDIFHKGKCVMTASAMKDWLSRRPQVPLGVKLRQLREVIMERAYGTAIPPALRGEAAEFSLQLQELLQLNVVDLYREFLTSEFYSLELIADVEDEDTYDAILNRSFRSMENGKIYFDDACAITYLYLRLYDKCRKRQIKQVVIDEAQDYYPIQFEIISLLYPNAKFTVLGDINQTLLKQENNSFYKKVKEHLHKENSSLYTLNKSFRCTGEILQYALRFLPDLPAIESFNRAGADPVLHASASTENYLKDLQEEIQHCVDKGYNSICLITKSAGNASALKDLLSDMELPIKPKLILSHTEEDLTGLFLMPVYLSKGLEFDAVLVCDADAGTYSTEEDRNLLYVSCTRALHRLSLFSKGTPSPLLP
ncbi:MAG: AAA family ATPase [Acetatifactor sp.]|nr:AAA family ATPase [Acetatifactor sp.]